MTESTLETLKHLVRSAREDTAILDVPSLAFFREWLEVDLRATIPPPKTTPPTNDGNDDGNTAAPLPTTMGGDAFDADPVPADARPSVLYDSDSDDAGGGKKRKAEAEAEAEAE